MLRRHLIAVISTARRCATVHLCDTSPVNCGDLTHFPFVAEVWGTVAAWIGALLTGLSVLAAAIYYMFDRQRDRRTQASSVLVWLHPYEHGPPDIKIQNLSGKPIFDHACVISSKTERQIAALTAKGWTNWGRSRGHQKTN